MKYAYLQKKKIVQQCRKIGRRMGLINILSSHIVGLSFSFRCNKNAIIYIFLQIKYAFIFVHSNVNKMCDKILVNIETRASKFQKIVFTSIRK